MYSKTTCYLEEHEKFTTSAGVRQGGSESPYLYNIYADYCLKLFEGRCKDLDLSSLGVDFTIPGIIMGEEAKKGLCMLLFLGYADDLVIFANSADDLQKMMTTLDEIFRSHGL